MIKGLPPGRDGRRSGALGHGAHLLLLRFEAPGDFQIQLYQPKYARGPA